MALGSVLSKTARIRQGDGQYKSLVLLDNTPIHGCAGDKSYISFRYNYISFI